MLADDHTILRKGLRRILEADPELQVVAEASTGLQATELAERWKPDVAVLDIGMSEMNGIDATEEILRRSPRTAVLMLSMFSDERYVTRAARAGAIGYLLKDSAEEDLIKAVRAVRDGKSFFSPAVARTLLDSYAREVRSRPIEDRYDLLSVRERQVYQLVAEGKTNKEVAQLLDLSVHTVETHRIRVMEKLDVHSVAELVLSAVRRGLVS